MYILERNPVNNMTAVDQNNEKNPHTLDTSGEGLLEAINNGIQGKIKGTGLFDKLAR